MFSEDIISTKAKALRINLNKSIFGTFAEIGAGQEVARTFFQAGGASGTIAKTISAYDKSYSDTFYNEGKSGRYVSESRLNKMLTIEFNELIRLISENKKNSIRCFTFADTLTTVNFNKDNEGHGWLGVRFQLVPGAKPNDVIIHVNLLENDALLQQQSIGILGVNLIFACFYHYDRPNIFIQSLMDKLSNDRIEINMIRMSGPNLSYVDNRLLSVQLVNNKMTKATIFDKDGNVQQPSDMFYKKNILAFRGSFRPMTLAGLDMINASINLFRKDKDYDENNTITVCEITLNNLIEQGDFDEQDFLNRVDLLNSLGQNVMISNFREYYKLVDYFAPFKIKNLRIIIGVLTFIKVLEPKYYTNLRGDILEAFGRLFTRNMKLYVYPALQNKSDELLNAANIPVNDEILPLYNYLLSNKRIIQLKDIQKDVLQFFPHKVVKCIQDGDPAWEKMVPESIKKLIKQKEMFGYQG
ncbi:MAG: TonB-dependent receptor [Chlorobi bacterium]|nr:TonB-dependent receptor [Chlorobiota bacterium]